MVSRSSGARKHPPVVVQVKGEGALFTRPELRVERVTYPVMTPSAATGILDAIFWKPEFRWVPVKIEVLRPIQQFTLRRNETHDLPSLADAASNGRRIDTVGNRDQRSAVCLRDVEYRIHAQVEVASHADKTEAAYRDQFRRRVERGACYQYPFLGTREFPATFFAADDRAPIGDTIDLGIMLHRIHYGSPSRFDWFTARLEAGVLHIPAQGIPGTGPGADLTAASAGVA
ncbi:type I-C CRISPR-associated protein Cas5c [Micromonospora endophytica]|uniref:pre-crRNA processing endonuclease n=1 Tax=Micromonospora endophytica TaxID=515350 RepID=A0A2W2D3E6_9ACTN|nr:type I-C CRISPR-associated protein Cas5c [Micromonospora endophytica]PZF91786.1 type I-C CRISPR-associated protein Cas5 [Micromonospora endophytica]RIW40240.1 type I-C CRISPR-associated protein Cas5 [Micromonospora endophytica]BCJ58213.1 type I-C CRISPR-associated protein Cas5 [Micromonospora endophytica]